MSDYRVRFSATWGAPLPDDAGARLEVALVTMPGIGAVGDVVPDPAGPDVSATFWIDVRLGMADAARDGSRLAKEALKVAGMAEAQLVELSVTMNDRPA
jgi:hypothetical protein